MDEDIEISVVIPVLDEEDNISSLCSKLEEVMGRLDKRYEIIFIDDGSSDNSFGLLKEVHLRDQRIKIIRFRRNFGQTAAISAGFDQAKGRIVITMDADLQNDPEDIPRLLQKIDEGFDVVSGLRTPRKDPLTKKIPSRVSNFLARHLTGVNIHDFGCTLKAYKKESLDNLELYGEMHRYMVALVAWKGFRIGEIEVKHHHRRHGKTKYGWGRISRGLLDLVLVTFWRRYSARPMHIFGGIGILMGLIGFLLGVYLTIQKFFYGISLSDKPALLLAILLVIIGMQFIITGILSDIIMRVYRAQHKDNYSIKEKV